MNKPTILFLFNSSDYAPQPWLNDGRFNCVSVDYDDTDHSGAHRTPSEGHTVLNIDLSKVAACGDVRAALRALDMHYPSLVISFAPCTDLAVSGAAHFARKKQANPRFQHDATRMARLAEEFDCPYVVENPVSVLATTWRKPNVYVHPWQFSYLYLTYGLTPKHPEFPDIIPKFDWYNKKTGLWFGNGFKLPRYDTTNGPTGDFPGHVKLGGKSARTKYIRSLTPRSFAYAFYKGNCDNVLRGFDNG